MLPESCACFLVEADAAGAARGGVARRRLADLPPGELLVRVEWSSLNYKDALAATGHPGVVRALPHVPGVDLAGVVVESASPDAPVGARVLATGYDLGAGRWGGWSEYVRLPAAWAHVLPEGFSAREAMLWGTAGFTAALCVQALRRHDVTPDSGPIAVTGATGGVGGLAVMLLAKLGYAVAAITGKPALRDRLLAWGARQVLAREEALDAGDKPLLKARWAGAVDTVGGPLLGSLIRACQPNGCVAACGLAASAALPITVHPFILRGVTLAGVDSAWRGREERAALWRQIAGPWRLPDIEQLAREVGLDGLSGEVAAMLRGEAVGRVVARVAAGA